MKKNDFFKNIAKLDLIGKLKYVASEFVDKTVFTTSFGIEDQVITDMIFANDKAVKEDNADPYYTNSSQLPVNFTDDIFEALDFLEFPGFSPALRWASR